MQDWTGFEYETEILSTGFHSGPAEDEAGLLPGRDGQTWALGGDPS